MNKQNVKKRNWAFVLYPESAPEGWLDQLQGTGCKVVVSPLHDKDIDPNGELKKAHYHVIIIYDGPTSFSVIKRITDSLNQPIPQPLEQLRGYYRYLTHKDNPDKYQYNEKDIVKLNGFQINDYIDLTRSEVTKLKKEIFSFIADKEIVEYCDLLDGLRAEGLDDHWEIASNNTIMFNTYLSSKRNKTR